VIMELVIDTNILVSAILRSGLTRKLLFDSTLDLYTPDFVFSELRKHNKEFIQKSGLDEDDYISAVGVL
jgi:predicted nucleic acid-binding protein